MFFSVPTLYSICLRGMGFIFVLSGPPLRENKAFMASFFTPQQYKTEASVHRGSIRHETPAPAAFSPSHHLAANGSSEYNRYRTANHRILP